MVLGEVDPSQNKFLRGWITSMRPRVGSRGSTWTQLACKPDCRDFNEAPSWFSGKFGRPGRSATRGCYFNEAPSWFSGKWGGSGPSRASARATSMRPRVGSRGSDGGGLGSQYKGFYFNEAPSWFSGKSDRRVPASPPHFRTSMRPRVGSRGSAG